MTYGFPGQERSPEREKEVKKNSAEERESVMTKYMMAPGLIFAITGSETGINDA